ncbi:MAG TPA: hypothetical protein VGL53_23545 [Bryobacteraceae bacterium]
MNTMLEERLFALVAALTRIADALSAERIPYEVIGGLAVLIHVEEANPEYSALTRDVDLMVRREDLERIKDAALKAGFHYRHTAGVDMLIHSRGVVRLTFGYSSLAQEIKQIHGQDVSVIPVAGLLQMKLRSFRLKDQVHVKSLDAAGLITLAIEHTLPAELFERLTNVRQIE